MTIAVDFDGLLFEEGGWPGIGAPILSNLEVAKKLCDAGHHLILWTCRTGEPLKLAVEACASYGIRFVSVNSEDPSIPWPHGSSRKVYADVYWDDRSVSTTDLLSLL